MNEFTMYWIKKEFIRYCEKNLDVIKKDMDNEDMVGIELVKDNFYEVETD